MVLADERRAPAPASRQDAARRSSGSRPDPTGRRAPRRREASWTQTGLLALALSLALWGFHPLLDGFLWWLGGTAMIAVVLAVAALLRTRTRSRVLPPLGGAIAAALLITPIFAPQTALFGLVPTGTTGDALVVVMRRGFQSIQEQSIPATADAGILLLVLVPIAGIAVLSDVLVLEAELTAFAAAPLLGLLAVPLGVQEGITDAWVWITVAVCYLVLLRRGLRSMPRGVVLVTGAIAVAGSLLLPQILPPVTPQTDDTSTGVGGRANPLIDLGADLRQGTAVTVLTTASKASAGTYMRIATLSDFRGQVWEPDTVRGQSGSIGTLPDPDGLTAAVPTTTQNIAVSVTGVGGRRLPLPYPATRVTDLSGDWTVDPIALTATSSDRGVNGLKYGVRYSVLTPTVEQLRTAPAADGTEFRRYLAVPSDIDPVVEKTARQVVGDAPDAYDQAIALQDWFRSEFTYSEQTPVDDGYDGAGIDVLPAFLKQREGYCVHFSSAMAVMARQLGIPSRVVVGYLPGERNGTDDSGRLLYDVSSRDLHAWPELYFSGVGWVRFEPTASRGDVPSFTDPTADDPSNPTADPTTAPTASATPSASTAPNPNTEPSDSPNASAENRVTPLGLGFGGAAAVIVLLLLSPAISRRILRWRRFVRIDAGSGGAEAAWDELRDSARDVGWHAPPTETVAELAWRLESALPERAEAIDRVRAAVEAEAYGRYRSAGVDLDDLREVLTALLASAAPRERVRAVLAPPSLLDRVGGFVKA